jgi:hypothetical protein
MTVGFGYIYVTLTFALSTPLDLLLAVYSPFFIIINDNQLILQAAFYLTHAIHIALAVIKCIVLWYIK